MSRPEPSPTEPPLLALARKIVLLALWMVVVSIGLVALILQVRLASPILTLFFANSILGLAVGLPDRWLMRRRTGALRFITALAFVAGSLKLLGWFTGARMGIASVYNRPAGVDWPGLAQFLVSGSVALLSVYAWRRKRTAPKTPTEHAAPAPEQTQDTPEQPAQPKTSLKRVPQPGSATQSPGEKAVPGKQPAKKISKPRRINRRKLRLRLSGEEEHRCPYCLEPIEVDDPRGVVECQICHTLHHADCWAITGACQVPHFSD